MSSYEFWDELGKIFNAVVAYQEKNREFNKRFISPWIRLGNVFEKQDRNKEAISAYERAIELDGSDPQNWFELGNIHFKMENHREAIAAFNRAIELDPAFGLAYSNLALSLVSIGETEQAVPLFERAIDLLTEPADKAVAWNRLGNAYRKLNQYEEALGAFHKADEFDRDNGGFRDSLDEVTEGPVVVQAGPDGEADAAQTVNVSPIGLIVAENSAAEAEVSATEGKAGAAGAEAETLAAEAPIAEVESQETAAETLPASDPSIAETEAADAVMEPALQAAAEPAVEQPVAEGHASQDVPGSVAAVAEVVEAAVAETAEPAAAQAEAPEVMMEATATAEGTEAVGAEVTPAGSVTVAEAETVAAVEAISAGEEPVAAEALVTAEAVAEPAAEVELTSAPETEAAPEAADAIEAPVAAEAVAEPSAEVELTSAPEAEVAPEESKAAETPLQETVTVVVQNSAETYTETLPLVQAATETLDAALTAEPAAAETDTIPEQVTDVITSDEVKPGEDLDDAAPIVEETQPTAAVAASVGDPAPNSLADQLLAAEPAVLDIAQQVAYEEYLKDTNEALQGFGDETADTADAPGSAEPMTKLDPNSGELQIEMDTKNAHVWNELGNVYFNTSAYDDAIVAYSKAIELDRWFAWPYSNLALAYVQKRRFVEAILLYQRSIELFSSDKDKAISWNRLGNVYRRLNDYENAIAAYQRADALDPDNSTLSLQSRFSLLGNYAMEQKASYVS